ncbi:sister chromatid cohesion 1 protein 4-like [Phragmites australis]|uniref:sister chromatid cohesion 1 protein 4-like n=1 Tax=Phragmites australis TaxID=29695 RepID=UPI002D78A183|nr:sister chromatid cohesion 1 protein 4-like [Phragmites australis]
MFYSQFILAKKGPLGTIWIAAHLERKLRKNQVADTDIGVSVDSIIFPDVPIALRLSSHLMLGVVRIYSRKVNYLFHDCSEALLKIKQAFRSAAVDLPPEESTAPYHSITLPETFHLDDFELPEAAFQGDIDHHVSTKEQITLQDNPERTGYSTSQFGLDERFGDGSSSHIGLDLEEELMLNKDHSIHLESDDGIIIQGQPSVPTDMDVDDNQSKDEIAEGYNMDDGPSSHRKLSPPNADDLGGNSFPNWNGYNVQTPDLNDMLLHNESIAGPSASYYQPSPFPCDEPASPEFVSAQAPATPGLMEETVPSRVHGSPVLSPQIKASPSGNDETAKAETFTAPASDFLHPTTANASDVGAEMTEYALAKPVQDIDSLMQQCTREDLPPQCQTSNLEAAVDKLVISTDAISACGELIIAKATTKVVPLNEPSMMENPAQINEPSVDALGDNVHATNADFQQEDQAMQQEVALSDRPNEQSTSEFAEPEKMLSAPDAEFNQANDLGQITAEKGITESDGSNKIGSLTSRKRHLEDSLPALESETTEKLSSRPRGKRITDFVPDDDDLLASILVGRRTPGLTLGSTPLPPRASSLKRPRLGSKIATLKRKVQLDDAMVLHADTIRQQLINTEDIRRIRKKAPCTRSEIWMIEKGSMEGDIFREPIFSSLSEELNNLHDRRSYEIVEVQGLPVMSEIIAEDSNNVGTSDAKGIGTIDDLLHIPDGTRSDVVQPEANNAACATAALGLQIPPDGLQIPPDNQVNGVSNDFVADTVFQGVTEPLIDTEKEVALADRAHAQVDTLDNDHLQDIPSDLQHSTDAKVSSPDVVLDSSGQDFNHFVHSDVNVIGSNEIPTSEITGVECNPASGFAQPTEDENALSAMGDNSCFQENNMGSLMDLDTVHDFALKECNDFGSAIHGVDTDFLNYDDDGDYDDANNDEPNPDEFQSLDNSGWSSRTRGVAKYLKTLFDEEAGLGRKSVAIDRLLSGKTRKEASRMFFETLVLTTKDYINVEQPNPFDFVSIKPGPKLLKSDF